jgi:signal transduction histidine kinase
MLGTPFVRRMVLLGSAILLVTTLQLLPEQNFNRARDAEQLVSHTLRVLNATGLLLSTMEDAETGQRGYLLTGDDHYLETYQSALSNQALARQTLRKLTSDNNEQQARLGKLDQLVETRLSVSRRIIALYRADGRNAALAAIATDEAKRVMDEIRGLLRGIETEEHQLLKVRTRAAAEAQDIQLKWILRLGGTLLIIMIGVAGLITERVIGNHERVAVALRIAETELNRINAELEERVRRRTLQLEASNRELEAFAYSVSHDLRAPLRGIDGWSLALLEDYAASLDAGARQYLNRVRSETQRMGNLIDDLLQLSRVSRGEMKLDQVDLTSLAYSVVARLRDAQPERSMEFAIAPDLVAFGDVRLLDIALTNLLSNAVKFTASQNETFIEFGRRDKEGEMAFYVRDNGVGFDMAYAANLFGAFQRLHKVTEFPGTGIGLATVQRIVRRHGGRVWAEARVNRGATFSFTLGAAS